MIGSVECLKAPVFVFTHECLNSFYVTSENCPLSVDQLSSYRRSPSRIGQYKLAMRLFVCASQSPLVLVSSCRPTRGFFCIIWTVIFAIVVDRYVRNWIWMVGGSQIPDFLTPISPGYRRLPQTFLAMDLFFISFLNYIGRTKAWWFVWFNGGNGKIWNVRWRPS